MKNVIIIIFLLFALTLNSAPSTAAVDHREYDTQHPLAAWLSPLTHLNTQSIATTAALDNPLIAVARFYQEVDFQTVWTDPDGLKTQGKALLNALLNAPDEGLRTEDYFVPYPDKKWTSPIYFQDSENLTHLAPYIQLDVALTQAALRYSRHLAKGRIMPETLFKHWLALRRPLTRDIPHQLAGALQNGGLESFMEGLGPRHKSYQYLKTGLKKFEAIRDSGGWPEIGPGPTLKTGDHSYRVEKLRSRLISTGDLSADASRGIPLFNEALVSAVKHFQRRHGLKVDGIVGRKTRDALDVSVESRIIQMQLNMERWRWFPDSFGKRYVMVNIPGFELNVVENDRVVKNMRAIVGKKHRRTPVMSGRMTYLELNPYWNVPGRIARRDILPKILKDPEYLVSQGIKIFDSWEKDAPELDPFGIDWDKVSRRYLPYRFRQDPSPLNALGQVKFMFPNHQSVYIHDTPGKELFQKNNRYFSSGCVRVENPLDLADHLLEGQNWDRDKLASAVEAGKRKIVILKNPVPVHLVYFTAWVDEGGQTHFRKDIYGRDKNLLFALGKEASTVYAFNKGADGNHFTAKGFSPST